MATAVELAADAAAFKDWVDKMLDAMGFIGRIAEGQIPAKAFLDGATAVINAAEASADQSNDARQAAGNKALRAALNSTGQGGRVNDQQCAQATQAVLLADYQWRAAHSGK